MRRFQPTHASAGVLALLRTETYLYVIPDEARIERTVIHDDGGARSFLQTSTKCTY